MANTLGMITVSAYVANDPFFSDSSGTAVARFRVLHNPFGKREDKTTDLPPVAVNFVAFGKTAEIVKNYVKKGGQVTVVGNIKKNEIAKDKQGQIVKTQSGEIVINLECDVVQLHLGAKATGAEGSNGTASASAEAPAADVSAAPF